MTKERAVEILQELWRYKETDKYTETEIRQALDKAIIALKEQITVTEFAELGTLRLRYNGWIPASESLPKAGEYVGDVAKYYLVQNEYGDMLVARYTHSEYWEQMYQHKPIADEIVAWMPLPEPYNGESEDKQ